MADVIREIIDRSNNQTKLSNNTRGNIYQERETGLGQARSV